MNVATAHLTHTGLSGDAHETGGPGRRAVRRPVIDLGPWLAPLGWMAVLALTVSVIGAGAMLKDGVPSGASTTISVRVNPSDTLWSIARANRLPGASTAETVEVIARINDLAGTSLRAGAVLQVPVEDPSGSSLAQADAVPATP